GVVRSSQPLGFEPESLWDSRRGVLWLVHLSVLGLRFVLRLARSRAFGKSSMFASEEVCAAALLVSGETAGSPARTSGTTGAFNGWDGFGTRRFQIGFFTGAPAASSSTGTVAPTNRTAINRVI